MATDRYVDPYHPARSAPGDTTYCPFCGHAHEDECEVVVVRITCSCPYPYTPAATGEHPVRRATDEH